MGYDERPEQPQLHQFGGLNVRVSELGLPDNDSPYMVNIDLHPEGSIRKRYGISALTTPTGQTKIEAIIRLDQPEQSRGWIYCIAGGKVYRTADPGSWSWVECTSSPSYTLAAQKSWGRENSRYYASGTEHPSVLYLPRTNGAPLIALGQTSATGDIITMPAAAWGTVTPGTGTPGYPIDEGDEFKGWTTNHWPKYMRLVGIGRGARMHAWGFADDPNRVDFSEMNVPWNFMRSNMDDASAVAQPLIDGGFYYARRGDGDAVVAVIDMFSYTVVLKKHRTLIYTGDPGADDWSVAADFPVGCVSDRAWAKVGNDLLFWSEDGVRALSAVQEYGDLAQGDLSFKIGTAVRAIVPGAGERVCCYHDITNARVVWFIPLSGDTKNDAAFVYYYNSKKWTKWDGAACEMMDVSIIRATSVQAERVIGGSYDNGVVLHGSGYKDISDSVATEYYTNWINFGSISDAERALWLDMFYGQGGVDVDIYYQTDLNDEWIPITRLVKSFGSSGTVWGKFIWGQAVWGVPGRAHRRFEMNGLFGLVRFKFSKTSDGGFEIMGYRPEIRVKGPRA
jgi:hypothetical protein